MTRRSRPWLFVGAIVAIGGLISAYLQAIAPAKLRAFHVTVKDWPAGQPPVRLVLISDTHIVEPETPPARIARLVTRINALAPTCVLIAGDLVSDKFLAIRHISFDEALRPFAELKPGIATFVVRGNHDHWRDGTNALASIRKYAMRPLVNEAVRCGLVTIGGVDDIHTGHADVARTKAAMAMLGGVPILLSHSPDVFPEDGKTGLTLAGHTHCGQIRLPFNGAPAIPSHYGNRFACGVIREGNRTLIVTSGIGTSIVPLRWFAPPDMRLITVGP